jgi:hypothetical protein
VKRRLCIVFEETDEKILRTETDGQAYNVYLEGFDPARKHLPEEALSAAEFWALKMFALVVHTIHHAGGVKTVSRKP